MSIYRNTVWLAKGLLEYTKAGYAAAARDFVPGDLEVDCTGRHYLITGSNSGIGREMAGAVAARGGTVHMVCRNQASAEAAREEIVRETGNEAVHVHVLDLSEIGRVEQFTAEFTSRDEAALHVLVNNAGCMVNTRELTPEGFERNFATNTLGTYTLTEGLVGLIQRTTEGSGERGRVVTVSSGGMLTNKLVLSDLQTERGSFDGTMVYAQNKRQQVVMTEEWAGRYPSLQFSSMHPGWSETPAVRNSMPGFYEKMKDKLRSPAEGADTAVWLAVAGGAAVEPGKSGEFWQDRRVVGKHLPLAWSRESVGERSELMERLEGLRRSVGAAGQE